MISLKGKQEIILKSIRENKSQRQIHRETGIARETIRRYVKEYEEELKNSANRNENIEKVDISIEYNIMTLQHYVNCIMGISEILNSVSKIQKEIKRCDEKIRKLDDGQVEERKNKETEKNKFVLQNE